MARRPVADQADVRRMALSLPETSEAEERFAWRRGRSGKPSDRRGTRDPPGGGSGVRRPDSGYVRTGRMSMDDPSGPARVRLLELSRFMLAPSPNLLASELPIRFDSRDEPIGERKK